MVEKHIQTMVRLLDLVYAVCTWGPERLEQIVDIPVPQIEEEIAEVDRFLHCVKQYLEPLFPRNQDVSGMSLYETGHSIQTRIVRVMCLSEQSVMRMHACFQFVVLSLTSMSTDIPH